ncbi:methyltransferase domain-containing protein [Verrucomicrobiota bacterium]
MSEHRFSVSASTYDRHARPQQILANALLAELVMDSPDRILELGGGTGQLTRRILGRYPNAQIDVVDIAPGMVEFGRQTFADVPNVCWELGDAQAWRARDLYPLVVSSAALHWTQDLQATFANVYQNLLPRGAFVFGIMLDNTFKELRQLRSEIAPNKVSTFSLPTYHQTVEALEQSGFRIELAERTEYLFPYENARAFLKVIHEQGVTGGSRESGYAPLARTQMLQLIERYQQENEKNGQVYATYETVVVVAVRP